MINLEVSNKSVRELLLAGEVDAVIQGCNCFHVMVGPVADTLKEFTGGDIAFVDANFSPYGDINNLGTWTNNTYTIADKEVEIYNLYCQYTLGAPQCDPVHWASVHDALIEIISESESEKTIGLQCIGCDVASRSDFISILTTLIQRNEDDLPDVNLTVFYT